MGMIIVRIKCISQQKGFSTVPLHSSGRSFGHILSYVLSPSLDSGLLGEENLSFIFQSSCASKADLSVERVLQKHLSN